MPGKSRRQKEKRLFKPVAVTEPPASFDTPAITVTLNQPSAGVKTTTVPATAAAKAARAASSYVNRELLTIAVMTVLILVFVVVLSTLLS